MSGRRSENLLDGCSPYQRKLVAQLADLNRALYDASVEHRIVVDEPLHGRRRDRAGE